MLVLSREPGERIFIGPNITVAVSGIRNGRVKLAIEAPVGMPIRRERSCFNRGADARVSGVRELATRCGDPPLRPGKTTPYPRPKNVQPLGSTAPTHLGPLLINHYRGWFLHLIRAPSFGVHLINVDAEDSDDETAPHPRNGMVAAKSR